MINSGSFLPNFKQKMSSKDDNNMEIEWEVDYAIDLVAGLGK
jgi:hypothetical protein